MLSSYQNFEHKGLVFQIVDITKWSVASVCPDYYLHIIDMKALLGLGTIIQIGWQGFDLILLLNIIKIGCLVKVLVLLW